MRAGRKSARYRGVNGRGSVAAVALEVRILGPLAVSVDGRSIELGKGNERALFALLALEAGKPVSRDRIVDALWDDDPPATVAEMVRIYVARIRGRLGETRVARQTGGYALDVDPERVDALRFERLCKDASRRLSEEDAAGAARLLDEALGLWRGPALADAGETTFVREARARLDELRLQATEDRIDSELALGRAGELTPELEQLVRSHPQRDGSAGSSCWRSTEPAGKPMHWTGTGRDARLWTRNSVSSRVLLYRSSTGRF